MARGRGVAPPGQGPVAEFALAVAQRARLLLAQVQHVEHGLLGQELEAAQALLVLAFEFELAQRLVLLEHGLGAHQEFELAVELGVLDLLAILFEPLQALLDHHEVAEDEFGFDVLQIAHGVHRALLVGDGFVGEQPQHMGEGVHHAQAADVAGLAQVLLGDGGHVHVLDGGMRHLGRFEQAAERFHARVGHLGHARTGRGRADARLLVDAGEDREQRGLAHHGQTDDGGLHIMASDRVPPSLSPRPSPPSRPLLSPPCGGPWRSIASHSPSRRRPRRAPP